MIGIERRAKRDLFSYLFADRDRYVSLAHYAPSASGFAQNVKEWLPDDWQVFGETGIWFQCLSPRDKNTAHGFKIHVSATFDNASQILEAVVPILVEDQVTFKCLCDADVLDFANSQAFSRSACGKFITIYPDCVEQFKLLLQRLHSATAEYVGPYILSDKRYRGSKVLFYRYGAFRNVDRLNIFGETESCIRDENGGLIIDERLPYFSLPDKVLDPFEDVTGDVGEPLLHGRYLVKSLLGPGASSKGGVYVAEDTTNGREIVIKEARPLINRSRHNPYDAVACLRHEYDVLKRLENSGHTPRPVEIFSEWEHTFLVLERAAGVPLSSYRAYEAFSIMVKASYTEEELRTYCRQVILISEQLLDAVRTIHRHGIVIQDLAPQNILIDPEDNKVTLLDFESAYDTLGGADSPIIPLGTVGFSRIAERGLALPSFADDYYALSNVLSDMVFPISLMFPLNPRTKPDLMAYLSRERGVPEVLMRFILSLPDEPERADELLAQAKRETETITMPQARPARATVASLEPVIANIAAYIDAQVQMARGSGLLPTDYRRYATNPLSVAYGYCGVAQFMQEACGRVPTPLIEEILAKGSNIRAGDYPPGLYIGNSGIAWVLENLGYRGEGERIMKLTAASELINENADVFYGTAGWGLANLLFYNRTGDEEYLTQAKGAAEQIIQRLQVNKDGLFYENLGDTIYYGYAHGASGIALFFARLYQATGREQDLDTARRLLDFDIAAATERDQHLIWSRSNKESPIYSPYQRIGSAGVASVLLRFHDITGEAHYLDVARRAAAYIAGKLTVFPGQLSGMAGLGELFVDLYQHTAEEHYREEAWRFADRILLYSVERPEGLVFPGEELVRVSTDFATGSAGIGIFLRRLAYGGPRTFYDF